MLTVDQYGFSNTMIRWLLTYIGFIIVVVQAGLIGRLNRRFGEKRLINIGCSFIAIGLLLTPATRDPRVLCTALAFLAIGSGFNGPANQSLMSKLAPTDKIGGTMGVGQSLATFGRILGPALGAFAYQHFGHSSPYWLGAVAAVVALSLSLGLPDSTDRSIKPAG